MFCQYSDIFGKVKEGVHKYHLFNLAIVNVILTFIGHTFCKVCPINI